MEVKKPIMVHRFQKLGVFHDVGVVEAEPNGERKKTFDKFSMKFNTDRT